MKLVIKVGTQSILSSDGTPLEPVMLDLVAQLVQLQRAGHHIALVSSGAVGFGRKVARQFLGREYGATLGEKQALASLGQHELMHTYARMFRVHNILVSQLLLTKQDFQTRRHYLNIARLLHEVMHCKNILPIINENDSVAIEELMFTDNDELAGLIAAGLGVDTLIILSNVEGVYTHHPNDPNARLIAILDPQQGWPRVSTAKSTQGRGGMMSKLRTARKLSNLGITTHIASINQPLSIIRLVNGEALGTKILADKKRSGIKRWIAYSIDQKNGSISINPALFNILRENKRVMSILPIGIEKCSGYFKKGDLIEILAPNGEKIGIGVARYDVTKLKENCGRKNKPEFIHYDYLHIF